VGFLFTVQASLIQLVQLIQENGGVKFTIVAIAESLHGLVDGILVLVPEQVGDLSGPVHGLDHDLDHF
jgi:hypothetical protein